MLHSALRPSTVPFLSFLICLSTVISVSSGAVYFFFISVSAFPSSFLPAVSWSTLTIRAFSVLISFIPFSSLSPFCFFLSLHLSLYLFFTSRNLFLSILVLFHFLNAFTASFFNFLYFFSHHSVFLPVPFATLTIVFFFVVAFSITSFNSTAIFSTSCSSNLTFSFPLLLLLHPIFLLPPSSAPPLFCLFPFLHDSFLL
jgi:hypothetical protein